MSEVPQVFGWIFDSNTSVRSEMYEMLSGVELIGAWEYWIHYPYAYIPKSIKEVTIWGGDIQVKSFSGLRNIEKVTLGDGITYIGEEAFFCEKLEEIEIPKTVTRIGYRAVANTAFLENLTTNSEDGYVYINNVLYQYTGTDSDINNKEGTISISEGAFKGNTTISNVKFSFSLRYLGVENIYNYFGSFFGCTGLTKIELNEGLEYIGGSAFWGCSNLKEIKFPNSIQFIEDGAFYSISEEWENSLPDGEVYIGKVFYKYKGEMPEDTVIELKDGTVGVAMNAFQMENYTGFENLKRVVFPDTVTYICNGAFAYCTNLTDVVLPKNLTRLGVEAFWQCHSIDEIVVPKGVRVYSKNTFGSTQNGIKITFEEGSNLTDIANDAFKGLHVDSVVYLPNSDKKIYANACCTKAKVVMESLTSFHTAHENALTQLHLVCRKTVGIKTKNLIKFTLQKT